MRKPFFWATHTSFSMERGSYKAVLFPHPTHSEGFLWFCCTTPHLPTPTPPPILHTDRFSLSFLLLLHPASFFGLFAWCCRTRTLTSQHTNSISLKTPCSPQEYTITSAPATDQELLWTDPETLGFWQWRELQCGEAQGSAFSLCQQWLTLSWFYSAGTLKTNKKIQNVQYRTSVCFQTTALNSLCWKEGRAFSSSGKDQGAMELR